jgi:hypothetical protein
MRALPAAWRGRHGLLSGQFRSGREAQARPGEESELANMPNPSGIAEARSP